MFVMMRATMLQVLILVVMEEGRRHAKVVAGDLKKVLILVVMEEGRRPIVPISAMLPSDKS